MSESGITEPRSIPRYADEQQKPAKKTQPQFPFRITFSMAPDQIETLAQARKIYRASDAFMLRLAWDQFCRANQLVPSLNNGVTINGR